MATKKIKNQPQVDPSKEIASLRQQLAQIRLDIKSGVEKNTNAHKSLKHKLAQLLTKKPLITIN